MAEFYFNEIARVNSGEFEQGEYDPVPWEKFFVLYSTVNLDTGLPCFDLYAQDKNGTGYLICSGTNESKMRDLLDRLGT